ncbi:hypothetical protein DICVIV_09638 [Dictyocaulus viviparus]|uniref:PDZ domain-containing protein n=1 Tax=Dictyocaulus viviparus TaxID=29172 RepID=A0A0D8XKM7_DICVI|nr:hypothetical protein DICVIV_09638 [Dictyocaulus viviparus]
MTQNCDLRRGKAALKFKRHISVGVEVKDSKIVNILPSSELLGVLFVGDIILTVNGVPTPVTADFTKAINSNLPGSIVIEYLRDEMCTYELKQMPPQKAGYDQFEITLIWRSGGTPIGLLIHRDFSKRVVVAMVESGCTASKVVRAGDILLKVNNKDVADRDVARKLIMESINTTKRVSLTLERCTFSIMQPPMSASTYQALTAKTVIKPNVSAPTVNTKLDVPLPADVLRILENNKNFYMVKCTLPPCLKRNKNMNASRIEPGHLSMSQSAREETTIPYDPSPKPLKITPRRVGS